MDSYTILKDIALPIMSILATPISFYLGFTKGTGKTIDIAIDKLEKKLKKSPTAQRILKIMEKSDEIFGDNQAVEQITGFFSEARGLVGSQEAKNFFANMTELMKQLGTEKTETVKLKLPEKPRESC
jgi:hypothetical protein